MNKPLLIILLSLAAQGIYSQRSPLARQLAQKVYRLNNDGKYENSVKLIHEFLGSRNLDNADAYYAYLNLSETHKRLFDYTNVIRYLDSAMVYARKTGSNSSFYFDNVLCSKAFALFDIQKYAEANVLMKDIEKLNYRSLDLTDKAYLIMQRGYLLQLDQRYREAELKYDEAIGIMQAASPCNLPVIYGKKISLYGYLNDIKQMQRAFTLANRYADSCKMIKYNLYAAEMMRNTYKTVLKDYAAASIYYDKFDSLNSIYNAEAYKNKLNELELKYETKHKEQALKLSYEAIVSGKRLIAFLVSALFVALLTIALVTVIYRRRKIVERQKQTLFFTRQLLDKTEEERRRIAADLHDSINNELLLIKACIRQDDGQPGQRIDSLIEHIRIISRNLHPVMFDELGLQDAVEQLAERVQEHNHFILNTEIEYRKCLDSRQELQVYRIIQEAVNNVLKYSNAIAALIEIKQGPGELAIWIKDNGKGFNVDETLQGRHSFGLHNIIARAHAIGGEARILSDAHGTTIRVGINLTGRQS